MLYTNVVELKRTSYGKKSKWNKIYSLVSDFALVTKHICAKKYTKSFTFENRIRGK